METEEKNMHHTGSVFIPNQELEDINEQLQTIFGIFMEFAPETALSDADRKRLLGSGVRRYGFIDIIFKTNYAKVILFCNKPLKYPKTLRLFWYLFSSPRSCAHKTFTNRTIKSQQVPILIYFNLITGMRIGLIGFIITISKHNFCKVNLSI